MFQALLRYSGWFLTVLDPCDTQAEGEEGRGRGGVGPNDGGWNRKSGPKRCCSFLLISFGASRWDDNVQWQVLHNDKKARENWATGTQNQNPHACCKLTEPSEDTRAGFAKAIRLYNHYIQYLLYTYWAKFIFKMHKKITMNIHNKSNNFNAIVRCLRLKLFLSTN